MKIELIPVTDENREVVLQLTTREDQPFCASNARSLEQAAECEAEDPGLARPFAIYVDGKPVGFCMFAFDPEAEDEEDRYWLWRFMIDQHEQGKGYGQAALAEIIAYITANENCEITTYSHVFDTMGTTKLEKRLAALEGKA